LALPAIPQIRGIWAYRHFILAAIRADLISRVTRSRIGAVWFVLHPVAQAAIFAIVLSEVMPGRLPGVDTKGAYAVHLISGLAAWTLFTDIVNRCVSIFIDFAPFLRKISFPRLCLPLIVAGTSLVNHVFLLLALVAISLLFGYRPGLALLSIPIGAVIIAVLAFGLGVFVGVLNVFSRDVSQTFAIVLQFWFWFTPIVYVVDILPPGFRSIAEANPMTALVAVYQSSVLHGTWPDWATLLPSVVLATFLVVLSFAVFRRASADLVDSL
jgi:lipopolysaccharide transport system permease protein